jgi:hypothetical protein
VRPANPDRLLVCEEPEVEPPIVQPRPCLEKLRTAIIEYGPMTVDELAEATGLSRRSVLNALANYRTHFVRVGSKPTPRGNTVYKVWGLREGVQ